MGYMRHHAILVTTYDEGRALTAREEAIDRELTVSALVRSPVNDYWTFFVAPDGSKEGWPESDDADSRRASFILWILDQSFEDGSSPFDWAEVMYGDENGVFMIRGSR